MDKLVQKLSNGKHAVVFEPRIEKLSELEKRLNQGFVFLKFIETQGETELGIYVDKELIRLTDGDFKLGNGLLQVVGTCELNFQKVRCFADINLETRQGNGYLKILDK